MSFQTRKTTGLLDPLVGYVQSQLRHFKMGADICQRELDDYLGNLRTSLEEIHKSTSQTVRYKHNIITFIKCAMHVVFILA